LRDNYSIGWHDIELSLLPEDWWSQWGLCESLSIPYMFLLVIPEHARDCHYCLPRIQLYTVLFYSILF
jgi:hypothetical protein